MRVRAKVILAKRDYKKALLSYLHTAKKVAGEADEFHPLLRAHASTDSENCSCCSPPSVP